MLRDTFGVAMLASVTFLLLWWKSLARRAAFMFFAVLICLGVHALYLSLVGAAETLVTGYVTSHPTGIWNFLFHYGRLVFIPVLSVAVLYVFTKTWIRHDKSAS